MRILRGCYHWYEFRTMRGDTVFEALSIVLRALPMKYPSRHRAIVSALATARRHAGLSQRQLAQRLGVPSNWVQRIESLERRVDVAEFIAIARALDVDALTLLSRVLKSAP